MDPQMKALLELMDQPVFLVRDGLVSWANVPGAYLVSIGMEPEEILGEAMELYEQWDRNSIIDTELTLMGCSYGVKIRNLAGADLFVLRPKTGGRYVADGIHTSGKLRQILQELFPATMTLQDYMEPREELLQEAARVNRSLYRLLRLSNKLGREEQLLGGGATVYAERTNLPAFLQEFMQEVGPVIEEGGWKLTLAPMTAPLYGNIDRDLMKQALHYMVSYGVCAGPRGSTLHLRVWEQGNSIRFSLAYGKDRCPGSETLERPEPELIRAIAALHQGALFLFDEGEEGCRMVLSIRKLLPAFPMQEKPLRPDPYCGFIPALVELSEAMDTWMYHPDRV